MNFLQTILNVLKNAKIKKYYRPKLIVLLLFAMFFTCLPWFASSEAKQLIASSFPMKAMDKYSVVVFFFIAALLVFQAVSFVLMLILQPFVTILSAIFEEFFEDIVMSSFGMILSFLIISNLSNSSWIQSFYEFTNSSPPIIQLIVEVTLGLDFVFSVYVGFAWLIEEYRDDHRPYYDVPLEPYTLPNRDNEN